MICRRCGIRMEESDRNSLLKGHRTTYRCNHCHEEVKIREKRSFIIPFFHHHQEEIRSRRAGPIELF